MRVILYFLAVVCFLSCKKGENDPYFSILSRKERITGKWTLKEQDITYRYSDPKKNYDSVVHETFLNNELSKDINLFNKPLDSEYDETIDINRDGSYERIYRFGVVYFIETGSWHFVKGSRSAKIKNKEIVVFEPEKIVEMDDEEGQQSEELFTGIQNTEVVFERIDELRNNEMKFIYQSVTVDTKQKEISITGYKIYIK